MQQIRGWLIDKGGIYVVVQFIWFGVIWLAPGKIWGDWAAPWDTLGRIIGGVMTLYGLVIGGLATINLGRNLQAVPHPKENATFVEKGAYRIVRHPIYSAIIIGWAGWGLFNNAELTALLVLVLFPFFDIKTRREERMLAAKFPQYADYRTRVRKLIPFLY